MTSPGVPSKWTQRTNADGARGPRWLGSGKAGHAPACQATSYRVAASAATTPRFKVLEGSRLQSPPSSEPGLTTFYTHTLCPYAERVWLSLLEKARACPTVLQRKPPTNLRSSH